MAEVLYSNVYANNALMNLNVLMKFYDISDDDDETTKQKLEIEGTPTKVSDQTTEMYYSDDGCQSHSALSSNDREASVETAIAEGNFFSLYHEKTYITIGLLVLECNKFVAFSDWSGQTTLPAVTFKFAAIFREGTFWKIGNAIRIETLSRTIKLCSCWQLHFSSGI